MGPRPIHPDDFPERPRPERRGRLRPNPAPFDGPGEGRRSGGRVIAPAELGEQVIDDEGRIGHRIVPRAGRAQ